MLYNYTTMNGVKNIKFDFHIFVFLIKKIKVTFASFLLYSILPICTQ